MTETIERIPLDQIQPHPANRVVGGFDEAKLMQLAESIKAVGVQQPAVVRARAAGAGYELVAGERRWRASRLAGLDYLPCVVRQLDDIQTLKIQVIENLQREDVHPLDETDGYERLVNEGGYDPTLIAQEVGRSVSYVYQRLRLSKLTPEARQLLLDGEISVAHAVLLARLGKDQQDETLKVLRHRVVIGDFSAQALDDWIRDNVLMMLSKVAWKLDDATLVAKAGPCSDCQKRTGADPALFEDLSADHCTDKECFQKKQSAIIKRNKGELGGNGLLVSANSYVAGPAGKGVLVRYDWEECKKKDEGAVRCLIIDGDSPGRLVWGRKVIKKKAQSYAPTDGADEVINPEEEARLVEAEKRQDARTLTNLRLCEMILEKVRTPLRHEAALRYLIVDRLSNGYSMDKVIERHGWSPNDDDDWYEAANRGLEALEFADLVALLVEETIDDAFSPSRYRDPIDQSLDPLLKLFSIDAQAVQAAAHAELGVSIESEPEECEE